MTVKTIGVLVLASACFAGSAACCCRGGRTSHRERVIERQPIMVAPPAPGYVPAPPPAPPAPAPAPGPATLGKELEDLNSAYRSGAITREEFEAGKRRLLEQGGGGR